MNVDAVEFVEGLIAIAIGAGRVPASLQATEFARVAQGIGQPMELVADMGWQIQSPNPITVFSSEGRTAGSGPALKSFGLRVTT